MYGQMTAGKLDFTSARREFCRDVRNVCGGGEETFRRRPERQTRCHRRDGGMAVHSAGGDDEWRGVSGIDVTRSASSGA